MLLAQEIKVACRSLFKNKGLTLTVVFTLGLGIGVNAAIFSLVRSVLLRPLVNRDEGRILYLRQSAPGIGSANITFSVPEIQDLRTRTHSLSDVAEFSTTTFTMVGIGEPRQVRAGVVSGNYFEVMGLRPVLGRLLTATDDGPGAAGAAVVTHRFWSSILNSDPGVIGKTVRLESRSAQIVGVLEPSVPYPAETELMTNMVTSPHHLSATMVTGREHRMTEVFARMAPGVSLEGTRQDLDSAYRSIKQEFAEAYPTRAAFAVQAVGLREQLTSNARTVLIVLFAASLLIFVIACSNVANLILARTVRRESELALCAALGADRGALRRMLLIESLLLCGAGAVLGVGLAWSMIGVLSQYAARFSIRALELSVDVNLLWAGGVLAMVAAVLLAYIPRLPSSEQSGGLRLASSGLRIAGGTRRQLNVFAVTQIGASFVLIAGAVMLLQTFLALQAASPGFDVSRVLAVNVPVTTFGRTPEATRAFYRQLRERAGALPGVEQVAIGSAVPWRDSGQGLRGGLAFQVEGGRRGDLQDDPRANSRSVSPGYFAALGVPLRAGRDFTIDDRSGSESVVIITESIATRLFGGRDVLNRTLFWTDPITKFINISNEPRRIVGVVPDIDDQHIVPEPVMTVYQPFEQQLAGGRVFVHTRSDPYALVPQLTRIVRDLAADQPVEQAATLQDVRAEVLAPDRLNAAVFGLFAAVALVIAIVGVGGVLAFSVGGRTREFGILMALGSMPHHILAGVLRSGALIAAAGIALGLAAGFALARVAAGYVEQVQMPGAITVLAAGAVLFVAAIGASLWPAARAARTNVIEALRAE
jgi:putative ABC transport system permease protein